MCHQCKPGSPWVSQSRPGQRFIEFSYLRVILLVIALLLGALWNIPPSTEGVTVDGRMIVPTKFTVSP